MVRETCSKLGRSEKENHTAFWSRNVKEKQTSERHPGEGRKILLKLILSLKV